MGVETPTSGLGGVVRAARKSRNMTQTELARKINMSPSAISAIEHNDENVTASTLNAIAAALGYDAHVRFVTKRPAIGSPAETEWAKAE